MCASKGCTCRGCMQKGSTCRGCTCRGCMCKGGEDTQLISGANQVYTCKGCICSGCACRGSAPRGCMHQSVEPIKFACTVVAHTVVARAVVACTGVVCAGVGGDTQPISGANQGCTYSGCVCKGGGNAQPIRVVHAMVAPSKHWFSMW